MQAKKRKVIVIGGGAAGMMAAAAAASAGSAVTLYEKNEKCGKKIYITGKGRCNLTNNCAKDQFLEQVCSNRRFLYSALENWDSSDTIRFFEENGTKVKTERGNRVFPVSDHASDVTAALLRCLNRLDVSVHLNRKVKGLILKPGSSKQENGKEEKTAAAVGVELENGAIDHADAVIVATGGLSYPSTGSDGDGFKFARDAGLKVVSCRPSLVPMETEGSDAQRMQGLSLRNVRVRFRDGRKILFDEFGEMMFTHFGVSGPLILSASAAVGRKLAEKKLTLEIDLKSALTPEQLEERILREFLEASNKKIANVAGKLYPAKMIPVMLERCGIDPDTPVRDITKAQRRAMVENTKRFELTVSGLRGYNEAVITAGGVSVKEVRPDTMECKNISGLFFAGEVLDLDARTGGYNLQIAWTTGHAAGSAAGTGTLSEKDQSHERGERKWE